MFQSADGAVHKSKEECVKRDAQISISALVGGNRIDPVIRGTVLSAIMENADLIAKIARSARPKATRIKQALTIPA